MSWWKKLKVWQKAGIIVGGIHFVLYMIILFFLPPVGVYLLGYMELPWASILMAFGLTKGFGVSTDIDLLLLGAIGSAVYALFGAAILYIFTIINRKVNPKEQETP